MTSRQGRDERAEEDEGRNGLLGFRSTLSALFTGGGTAPFGFKTRRDIFRIARPFPWPKCSHRSPVYSAVYTWTRAFPHSSESYKRSTISSSSRKVFGNRYDCATTSDFRIMGADTPRHRRASHEKHRKNSIKRVSGGFLLAKRRYIRFGIETEIVARFRRPIPSNKATPSRSPAPYFEMYLRRTCFGIVNNLSSRASPCFDPFKCLLTRSVELQ